MPAFQDAFISYARADSKAFAIALKDQLKGRGLSQIWLDQDDIPSATDWQARIDDAIERSHHFVYIISPAAIASPYCQIELERAIAYGKRIIPLLHVGGGDTAAWAAADPVGCATIRLLNWIWCRDGVDDSAQYLDKLSRTLSFCDEQTGQEQPQVKAYVHQHTALLLQALGWERHHRQTRNLLVGSDRQAAETWLHTRFAPGEPLPCPPSDLHCEFITESSKNASNLTTQVFLCHSDQDLEAAEQIRRSLLRQGMTVWNYRTDIQTSQDYNSAIAQGIEEADNVVFLLSPQSAQSPYCQQELAQALALNKRVIPVLAAAVEPEQVPEGLKNLQHIDLTDNTQASDYVADESQLLRQLNTDGTYHTEHKTWLVQALKWQRQQQNPTLLLRGYNLRRAETWLKVARTHRHPPTALHEQFIAESLRQPPNPALDVFISYSRVDSDFARRLNDALQTQGKRTWFDQESIATGSDFQQEIYRGIESSDVFVFVLSPESVTSPFCADEVEYAQGLNKRMATVLHRAIDTTQLHPELAKIQWITFNSDTAQDFFTSFKELVQTLDTDIDYLRSHTRFLTKAIEWQNENYDRSFLLRGKELTASQKWLEEAKSKQPSPTKLQLDFITSSLGPLHYFRTNQGERIKIRTAVITSVAVTASVFILRLLGLMQAAEFWAYDIFMRQRPDEIQDSRMLLVTVDEASSDWLRQQIKQGRYQPGLSSIPDGALEDVLATLSAHNPAVIGLDIYRDFDASPALKTRLEQSDNFFGVCKATYQGTGVEQPPELPSQQVGFSDLVVDANYFVRRHYLKHEADPPRCDTPDAFSLRLARYYLEGQGVAYTDPFLPGGGIQDMAFGSVRVPQLWGVILNNHAAAYSWIRNPDILNGYQTMINFRRNLEGDANQFAPQISLKDLLTQQVSPNLVRGKIILIGYSSSDQNTDAFNTPYGPMSGVGLQGQLVSQLVSAALDNRPLIWWWSTWGETAWVFGWSLITGLTFWKFRQLKPLLLVTVGVLIALHITCYLVLVMASGWLPLIPAIIAILATGLCINYFTFRLRLRKLLEANQQLLEADRTRR